MSDRIDMRFVPHRFVQPGAKPLSTDFVKVGEVITNTADGKLFLLKSDGSVATFGDNPDLSGYATTQQLSTAIADIQTPDLTPYALKAELPDLSGLVTGQQLASAIEEIPDPDLSPYLKISDIQNVLQICKGSQDPRSLGLNVNPGFTWIEVGAMGEPVMSWQYATILGAGRWVSNPLGSMSYYTSNVASNASLFPLDGYALPFDLLPCYVSGYAQNGHTAVPGGAGGLTDSNQTYWTFELKPWPDASTTPTLATFKTQGINWPQTGIALAALVPCQPFLLQTQAIGGTKDYRTFFLKATKSGPGQLGLNQFSWTLSYRFVRRI